MLIIRVKSLLLLATTYLLTQIAVLAAPIPLNTPLNDGALFTRAIELPHQSGATPNDA